MAGEMIAMLHGLGGGRRYGLGDVMADADAAFADMEAALSNMGGQPAPGYTGAPSAALLPGDLSRNMFSQTINSFMRNRNTNVGANTPADYVRRMQGYTNPGTTGGGRQQGGYVPPSNLGTDWSVYALPVGILLAAAGVAWYMTREKAL